MSSTLDYKVHFISGLPRSGSTLLSAIFQQNPRFSAGVTGPTVSLFNAVLGKMSGAGEFSAFFDDDRRYRILSSLFSAYHYKAIENRQIVLDTNRLWTARASLIHELFPEARIVCCVREVPWILDSVERMVRRNPAHVASMFQTKGIRNVYCRVKDLMDSEQGLVGMPWGCMREAWFGEYAEKIIIVRYESLVENPEVTMRSVYDRLGEDYFAHDFNHIEYKEDEYDQKLGMPGMHTVKRKIQMERRVTVLPPDIFMKYTDMNFWENEKLNTKRVMVI